MNRTVSYLRKIGVLIAGIPVFVLGIILIPLPGPGVLVCLAALFILALEFEWAKAPLERTKAEAQKIIEQSKNRRKT